MSDLSKACSRLGDQAATLVLGARLAKLDGYWLELNCCTGTHLMPLRMMAQERGGQHRLGDVLARLKCKACRRAPAAAYLNETTNRTANCGAPPGSSVALPVRRGP